MPQTPQAKYQAKKQKEWRDAGLCVYCGAESGGKRRCPTCTTKQAEYMAKRRANAKQKQAQEQSRHGA